MTPAFLSLSPRVYYQLKTFSSKTLAFNTNKLYNTTLSDGEVSERLKEHAWKACVLETVPWVRIPPSPVEAKNGPGA